MRTINVKFKEQKRIFVSYFEFQIL